MDKPPVDLQAIHARLIRAGYPRPVPGEDPTTVRASSREAQQARAELREHIIDDVWALLDEVEELRRNAH